MECKDVFIRLVGTKLSVLIETLWNVKWRNEKTPYLKEIVLIETLWNVKKEEAAPIEYTAGINRNIVECKVLCPAV